MTYYLVLLLIAMSWTERAQIEPNTMFRMLFTALFALPLFKYRHLAPAVLAVLMTIRLYSVSPYGYLPSDLRFSFYLTLLLLFFEIVPQIYLGRGNLVFRGSSKGLIALLLIVILSNVVNLNTNYSFAFILASTIMLVIFVRTRYEIQNT